jgi:hypothetical protein
VRHLDRAAPDVQRRRSEPFDAQQLEADARADDIYNRVERAHLVKMNLFDRHIMNARFRFRESRKDLRGAGLNTDAQARAFDELENLAQTPVVMLLARPHVRAHGADARALNLLELHLKVADIKPRQLLRERTAVRPGAHKRAQRHVAADTGKAIEVEQTHKNSDE